MASEKENQATSEPGCFSRCTNGIVQFMENGFYKFGYFVGGHPAITILISSIIALGCAAGMIKFQQESRTEFLWVPLGSPSLDHKEFVTDNFKAEYRFPSTYLVEADDGNVLKPEILQKMYILYEEVLAITVNDENDDVVDWDGICYKLGPNCFATSLLQLWSFNSTIIDGLSESDIVNKVNEPNLISPVYFTPVEIESIVGGITRDGADQITSAKVTSMAFFLKDQLTYDKAQGKNVDLLGEPWEAQFVVKPDEINNLPFTVYRFSESIFEAESGESIESDLSLLATGYMLIIAYVVIAMSKFTFIEHKVYVSLAGVLTAGLAIISAMGLASAFGQVYGPVHSVLPFLLLGIGVDDMFVLVAAWYNLSPEEKKLDVREQVSRSLRHSGVSITLTSVTDFCAFLIGATTILPALRSFCIYCGIGIIFLFFFSITFFLSWLVIDQRRVESRRDACCCCFRHKDSYVPSEFGQRAFLQEFFYKYYSPALLNIPVKWTQNQNQVPTSSSNTEENNDEITIGASKIIVLLITFGLLGVCTWGTVTWEQNFDFKWFLPSGGNSRVYFEKNEEYFPDNGFRTAVYFDDVDYYSERTAMNDVFNDFKDAKWVQESAVTSWYESYGQWLVANKAGDPGLDSSNNWPKNATLFYDWLEEFITSPQGTRFKGDVIFNSDSSGIVISRINGIHKIFKNSIEEISGMDEVRALAVDADFQEEGEEAAFGYSEVYLNFESNKVIQTELLRNLALASACVFVIIFFLLTSILTTIYVFCCVIFTLIDLSGALNFWGITIDTVVAVQLILAIGLAVDYSVHIGHTFMIFSGSRNDRARATLGCMGSAVFNGGFSTFLAFILLAGSNSYIFTTFFKIFFLVVVFGLFHGLAFLPVVLSLIGPSPYLSAKPAEITGFEKTPRSVTPEPVHDEQVIVKDVEKNGDPRMAPVFNPAFSKEDEVEMKTANGSAHQDEVEMKPANGSAHQNGRSYVGLHQGPTRVGSQQKPPYQYSNYQHQRSTVNSSHHPTHGSRQRPPQHYHNQHPRSTVSSIYLPAQSAYPHQQICGTRESRHNRQSRQTPSNQHRQPIPSQFRQGMRQGHYSTRGPNITSVRSQKSIYSGAPPRYSVR